MTTGDISAWVSSEGINQWLVKNFPYSYAYLLNVNYRLLEIKKKNNRLGENPPKKAKRKKKSYTEGNMECLKQTKY